MPVGALPGKGTVRRTRRRARAPRGMREVLADDLHGDGRSPNRTSLSTWLTTVFLARWRTAGAIMASICPSCAGRDRRSRR